MQEKKLQAASEEGGSCKRGRHKSLSKEFYSHMKNNMSYKTQDFETQVSRL
jgi:hypothetical protein